MVFTECTFSHFQVQLRSLVWPGYSFYAIAEKPPVASIKQGSDSTMEFLQMCGDRAKDKMLSVVWIAPDSDMQRKICIAKALGNDAQNMATFDELEDILPHSHVRDNVYFLLWGGGKQPELELNAPRELVR